MVAITYHTTGVWGAGIEMNLTAAQVDANFDRLSVAVEDLITNPPAPVTPTSISRLGLTYTFHWSDDTEIDVSFPYVSEHWRGEWLPLTFYAALDSVTVAGVGGFAALLDHTSPAEFDPAQTIDDEAVWFQKYSAAAASLLSGLSDVDYTTPPTDGQLLGYDDGAAKWLPVDPPASSLASLLDVTFASLANNDFVAYDSGANEWTNRTPTAATALLSALVGDSGSGGTKGLAPAPAAGDAAAGKFLKADGTYAVPAGGGGTLASLSDVAMAAPATSDILVFDGSDWGDASPAVVTALLSAVVGDSGSGGTKGLVPAPAAGDAAAGKFLKADGTFAVPAGGGGSGSTNTFIYPAITNSVIFTQNSSNVYASTAAIDSSVSAGDTYRISMVISGWASATKAVGFFVLNGNVTNTQGYEWLFHHDGKCYLASYNNGTNPTTLGVSAANRNNQAPDFVYLEGTIVFGTTVNQTNFVSDGTMAMAGGDNVVAFPGSPFYLAILAPTFADILKVTVERLNP